MFTPRSVSAPRIPRFLALGTTCAVLFLARSVHAVTLRPDAQGISIDAGSMGGFNLNYPTLVDNSQGEGHKVIEAKPSGKTAILKYDDGAVAQVEVNDAGEITYHFDQVPEGVKNWRVSMLISFSYQQGGKWQIGNRPPTPFPLEKPEKPHLFQGSVTNFELTNSEGKSLSFQIPDFSYQQLTDNREWHWPIFNWMFFVPYNRDTPTYKVTLHSRADQGAKAGPLVDPFGQIKTRDWPDKVKSAEDLQTDAKTEQAYYASLKTPSLDKFGGLPGSCEKLGLTATGFFHVEKKGARWILVDPAGDAFYHLGVCAVGPVDDYTTVTGRESIYEWLPSKDGEFASAFRDEPGDAVLSFHLANMIRKYGKPYSSENFSARMIDRLRKWGFNSIGAFSPITEAMKTANFPYVSSLPLDRWTGRIKELPGISGAWDPFDEANRAQVERNFARDLPARASDPLLIGYFLVNEPIYEDIPKVVPTLKGTYSCKRVLVRMLGDKYKTIDAFNTAWGTSAQSFDELNDTPLVAKTSAASEDVHAFTGKFFDALFKLVADTFHKYDTHHMLIGNRFQPGTINNEQLCRTAGRYLDIMSFNYYTDGLDKDFLNRIYAWTGRPMILSEYYWSSPRESGLSGGAEVATQQDRGLAYRNYVEQSASLGYVVGSEWFTLVDQSSTGRWFEKYNGERANTGLISVTDRPWKPMLAEMMKTNDNIYAVWLNGQAPYVFQNARFTQQGDTRKTASIPHATGPIKINGATQNWPGIPPEIVSGQRLVFGGDAGGVEGTFKLCWDDTHLYLVASVVDPTPLQNQMSDGQLWAGDGIELFLGTEKIGQGGPLLFTDRHLLLGAASAGKAPFFYGNAPEQYLCDTLIIPGGGGKSYTLEAAIPWAALGIKPQVGQELLFDLAINDSSDGKIRRAQLMWNGTAKNSGDRTHWGLAKLQP